LKPLHSNKRKSVINQKFNNLGISKFIYGSGALGGMKHLSAGGKGELEEEEKR